MQYLVYLSGEVLNNNDKTYVISARSEEEAQIIAKNKFRNDFNVVDGEIYVKSHKRTMKAILAFVFLLIPILLSFVNWKIGHDTVSIKPSYTSCLYAVIFYLVYIVRFKGINRTVGSWIDITSCAAIVLLLSSLIQSLIGTKSINILGIAEISINVDIVLIGAILFSALGIKLVSIICMIGVGVLAILNMITLSNAMGAVCGPAYILCSFIGLLFYCSIDPVVVEAIPYMKKSINIGINHIKNDLIEVQGRDGKVTDIVIEDNKRRTLEVKSDSKE